MTGTYDTETQLIKTAMDNVYVKKNDVVDNLNSTSSTNPLSANQGKQLKDLVGNAIMVINGVKEVTITFNTMYRDMSSAVGLCESMTGTVDRTNVSLTKGANGFTGTFLMTPTSTYHFELAYDDTNYQADRTVFDGVYPQGNQIILVIIFSSQIPPIDDDYDTPL